MKGPTRPMDPPIILPAMWKRLDAFRYKHRGGLFVICTVALEDDGHAWRHISVSHQGQGRLPTWEELAAVKDIFLGHEALALQVLPPRSEYVNHHPNVLHLWECIDVRPTPDFRREGTL